MSDEAVPADPGQVSGTPTWFGNPDRPLAGWWHLPAGDAVGGVVLCPPIGRDYVNAYRCYRALAGDLAATGLAVLRFDLTGAGDSADGPSIEAPGGGVAAWLDSVIEAVSAMRDAGVTRIGLLGMRVGADLALGAISRGADVEAVVLWDPCTTLASWLREQSALMRLALPNRRPVPEGATETPGYVYPAELKAGLGVLQAETTQLPADLPVLGLVRPDRPAPERVVARVPARTVWAEAAEQEALLNVAEYDAIVPEQTMARIVTWLGEVLSRDSAPTTVTPQSLATATVAPGGTFGAIDETFLRLGPGQLFAVLTSPERPAGPLMVLLNNGAEHHVGPSRLWVELARTWAALGLRTLRLDLSGIGDSPPRPGWEPGVVYAPHGVDDAVEAVRLVQPDAPADVVLAGLCSGAFTAERAGQVLGARGVALLNPTPWGEIVLLGVAAGQDESGTSAYSVEALPLAVRIRKQVKVYGRHPTLRSIREHAPQFVWALLDRAGIRASPAAGFRSLVRGGTQVMLVFGDEDFAPYRRQVGRVLRRLVGTGRLELVRISDLDHALLASVPRREAVDALTATVTNWWAAPQG